MGIEAIAGLIPINLHLWKLGRRLQLHTQSLSLNYLIKSLLKSRYFFYHNEYHLSMEKLTNKQKLKVKSSIIDTNNRLNGIIYSFDPFNNEFSPGNRFIDMFPSCFSFYLSDRKSALKLERYIFANSMKSSSMLQLILKQQLSYWMWVSKTKLLHLLLMFTFMIPLSSKLSTMLSITSTKAELFAIRYELNQAIQLSNIEYIIVIADSIHAAKKIFNLLIHPYQVQTLVISKEIREFFERSHHNSIDFWNCLS